MTRRFVPFAMALVLLVACRQGGDERVAAEPWMREEAPAPWMPQPFELPPDPLLLRQMSAAIEFRQREEFDRFLDAQDPGELLEHATLTQVAIDRGIFGLDALFVFGDELFEYEFRSHQGLGNDLRRTETTAAGSRTQPNLRRVQDGLFGGPDSLGCATCHFKGGPDGAGTHTQNAYLRSDGDSTLAADERNPPHVLGLGPVQALAREMSASLQAQRAAALARAREASAPVSASLAVKGVEFGTVTAFPDGRLDVSGVEGVDADLVVKPFGWKGHQVTLRGMVEESFRIHLGVVSMASQRRIRDGDLPPEEYGDGPWFDVDRDGTTLEIDDGMVTTVVAYLAQLEVPIVRPPQLPELLDDYARGRDLFDEIGCADCHRPYLVLADPVLEVQAASDDGVRRAAIRIDLARDGEHPKIEPQGLQAQAHNVHLFSDLKRHDMGPLLASPAPQNGIPETVFLTRPLWGLAFTSPYLHDGRAPTLDDAIRLHGGEAAPVRDRYAALSADLRAALQIFLLSLTRQPKLFVP